VNPYPGLTWPAQHRKRSSTVSAPSYDRSRLRPGIVHLGVGRFHRAHQAVYLDDLAERGVSTDWGIVGVGLHSGSMTGTLPPQGCLYSVVERSARESRVRIVGSITEYLHGPSETERVLERLASPDTRVVSLTVTGNGYCIGGDGELALEELDGDLRTPQRPRTTLGYLVEGLKRRRERGIAPFTVMSCDNLPANGKATRRLVTALAEMRDPALARWIEAHAAFPSTVVDRITPVTPGDTQAVLEAEFGISDRCPVVTEPFRQWIVEDEFCNGRPPLEEVGARFVSNAAGHELVKKRLLNGAHCAMGYLGSLRGHRTVDSVMRDPDLSAFIRSLMIEEVAPLLPPVPGLDLGDYVETLLGRFSNPAVGDRLERLCARGSTKMPAYLIPSIADAVRRGTPHGHLTRALAAWFRYLRGVDLMGSPIQIEDAAGEHLLPLARSEDPAASLLGRGSLFDELAHDLRFLDELRVAYHEVDEGGFLSVGPTAPHETLPVAA
jgi:mannitol 2-dehydrogenase